MAGWLRKKWIKKCLLNIAVHHESALLLTLFIELIVLLSHSIYHNAMCNEKSYTNTINRNTLVKKLHKLQLIFIYSKLITSNQKYFNIHVVHVVEEITDHHHHAYNRRSEITHMNLVTCNGTAKVWRSASKNLSYISIFTCRILKTLRSIVPAITQKKLSNKFLVYEAEWNYVKMNRDGKCKSLLYYFF